MTKLVGVVGTIAIVFVLFISIVFGSWYTVDQGDRGVLLRNGALVGMVDPGLGYKMPFIDDVVEISVRSQSKVYEKVWAYSNDQQPAQITLSVSYHIPPEQVARVYSQYGSESALVSRVVDRKVNEQLKNVFGQYTAITAIQDRGRLNADVASAIQTAINGPIIVEGVQIEDIDFSDAYEASVEARMLAEVEVQKIKQNAQREKVTAEITVIKAKAQADAVVAAAKAKAQATELQGKAEAASLRARGDALKDNPDLIRLISAQSWNGVLPTTMLPNSTVPFINMTPPVEKVQ